MGPEISVIIPMRNESLNVEGLFRELTSSLTPFGRSYEILAIDDGSTDDTFQQLAEARDLAEPLKDPRVIRAARPAGGEDEPLHQAARVSAGAGSSRRSRPRTRTSA